MDRGRWVAAGMVGEWSLSGQSSCALGWMIPESAHDRETEKSSRTTVLGLEQDVSAVGSDDVLGRKREDARLTETRRRAPKRKRKE